MSVKPSYLRCITNILGGDVTALKFSLVYLAVHLLLVNWMSTPKLMDDANMDKCSEAPSICSRDSIEDIWGPRTPYVHQWPTRVDHACDEEPEKWVQSACVLCR